MADINDPQEDQDQTFETEQGTAGFPQRPAPPDPFGASADTFELPQELTPEELDERQAEMSERRRGGPPLPEGEDTTDASGLGLATGDALSRQVQPTEVQEPPEE